MNILENNANRLNDVIFEHRNKNYGAYVIRSGYDDSLKKSLLYMMSIVAMVFGSVAIYNHVNAVSENDKPIIFEDPVMEPVTYSTLVDITPPKPEPQQSMSAAAAPAGAIGTVINDDVVETNPANIDNPVNGNGPETATGLSPIGSETSSVTAIHIESAPVTTTSETVYVAVDDMPEFEGGTAGLMRYVAQNIVYPSLAREIGQEGTVHVSFVVNEIGNVESVKVMRGIGYGCDEEVVRVVSKMPKWKKAGKNAGHAVKVRYNIPVSFKLQ